MPCSTHIQTSGVMMMIMMMMLMMMMMIMIMMLMMVMVRCGEETRVVPRLLQMRSHWKKSQKESMRLEEAGLTDDVLASAISSFILEVVARHGEPAPRLCNKVSPGQDSDVEEAHICVLPGSLHSQVGEVPQGVVSQQQVSIHGQRRESDSSLHHQQKSHHYRLVQGDI